MGFDCSGMRLGEVTDLGDPLSPQAMGYYNNPWPGIQARRQRDEAEARAGDLQRQLADCQKEVERLRAKLKQYEPQAAP